MGFSELLPSRHGTSTALVAALLAAAAAARAATNAVEYDLSAMLQPVPLTMQWADSNYNIWCGLEIKGDDGTYHPLYSRWPRTLGHKAWVNRDSSQPS
jgi:methylaspartate ammonia-lyase